jgi:hypothetical protein
LYIKAKKVHREKKRKFDYIDNSNEDYEMKSANSEVNSDVKEFNSIELNEKD